MIINIENLKEKNNRGITLIALVITIIVLLILAGVSIAMLTGENGILTQAQNAKNKTAEGRQNEASSLDSYEQYIANALAKDNSGANAPVKKDGMEFVVYDEASKSWVAADENSKWYSYEEQTGATDTYNETTGEYGTSHWANARLNGNYYVWIPRYAYKIDTSVSYESQDGGISYKIDVKFIGTDVNQENIEEKLGESYADYIVHPAFTFGEEELSGFWVGKYETSDDGNGNAKIVANATAWREINPATMFNKSQSLSTESYDAHILKNTEWGAVAYLAQSQYGRNGTEVSLNQCSNYITGAGRGIGTETDNPIYNAEYTVNSSTGLPNEEQQYNGKIGKLSSTTGNVYGVYDMSGGAWEYVMGFYQEANGNIHTGYTDSLNSGFNGYLNNGTQKTDGVNLPEEKYYDLYINTTNSNDNYDSGKEGDATKETAKWNNDYANFLNSYAPVLFRGGRYSGTSNAGIFGFSNDNGNANSYNGFRICLVASNM